ncbi:unnamed protein product [Protopolystoma xenopodis]|uniref:Uncharacterized protein n=1 Tax=Protopolystoma xenopodis TaxID=117903 RepID=A0A448WID5_9PLAT|nr:unnamed protein product [Protopolystoma xenopodis]
MKDALTLGVGESSEEIVKHSAVSGGLPSEQKTFIEFGCPADVFSQTKENENHQNVFSTRYGRWTMAVDIIMETRGLLTLSLPISYTVRIQPDLEHPWDSLFAPISCASLWPHL